MPRGVPGETLQWFDKALDRGQPIPAARARRRWLVPLAAAVVLLALGGMTAMDRREIVSGLADVGSEARELAASVGGRLSSGGAPAEPAAATPAATPPPASASPMVPVPEPDRPRPAREEALVPRPAVAAAAAPPSRPEPTTGRTNAPTAPAREVARLAPTAAPPPAERPQALAPPPAASFAPGLATLTLPAGSPVAAPPAAAAVPPPARSSGPLETPSATAGASAASPPARPSRSNGDGEEAAVRSVLTSYEAAYSGLNADAAAAVYPGIDRRALARAFDALQSQSVQLRQCDVELAEGRASASCAGVASWVPKVGGGRQQQQRRWDFALSQAGGVWTIDAVRIR